MMPPMKALLCACLFVVACKGDKAKSASAETKPAEAAKTAHGPSPSLPDTPESARGERPHLANEPAPRDWSDPAVRDEMRERMAERRKARDAMLDTNHDGIVSPEERQARLKPMIERLDQNGDGKLTPDEMASSDRRMGFDDPAAIDTDHNGEISLGELDTAITARRAEMRAKWRGRNGGSAGVSGDE